MVFWDRLSDLFFFFSSEFQLRQFLSVSFSFARKCAICFVLTGLNFSGVPGEVGHDEESWSFLASGAVWV